MKKRIYLLFTLLLIFPLTVMAATGSIKASVSSTNITLNNTFTVTVKVNSSAPLGSWQYYLTYDKSKLSLVSGDTNVVGYGDGSFSSKSYTYKFKAIALGSASVSFNTAEIADWTTEQFITTSKSGVTVNIKEAVSIILNSDNNLASLSVEGFDLNPIFDKNTLEYGVTVTPDTTQVNILAKVNNNKSKITGNGTVDVIEGVNDLNVVVKAENGSTKTYLIKVTVPEKNPIEKSFKGKVYYISRKLPEIIPLNFIKDVKVFNDEEVPCLYNEKLNIWLLYLIDDKKNIAFYIYDEKNDAISLYNEVGSADLIIYLKDNDKLLKGFTKTTIKINKQTVNAWYYKNKQFYVLYGVNTITNEENYYSYDIDNQTLQVFNHQDFNKLIKDNKTLTLLVYGISTISIILLIILVLETINKNKYRKIIKYQENKDKVRKKKNEKK